MKEFTPDEAMQWAEKAYLYALSNSPDPHSKVGSVLICDDGSTFGTNRFPKQLRDCHQPHMLERPDKYNWITHAERDAVYEAVNQNMSISGSTLIVTKFPCEECMRTLGALGVRNLFSPHGSDDHPRWGKAFGISKHMMECFNIRYTEIGKPGS